MVLSRIIIMKYFIYLLYKKQKYFHFSPSKIEYNETNDKLLKALNMVSKSTY